MFEWLELEEQVGKVWHRLVGDAASYPHHPDAAVTLAEVRPMLGVLFRSLGGGAAVELAAVGQEDSGHRLSWRQRLGMDSEKLPTASLGEATLRLPESLDLFPDPAANRDLYLWLAAFFAASEAPPLVSDGDPLRRDLRFLRAAHRGVAAAL
ncbi:MAG: protein norD, partial [Caenispirillum bisanense]|nr:protein norD [Caenispirillum bisanense]